MVTPKKAGVQTIQCLERATDILTEVGRAGEAGISQMARALSLHVPTVSNIVRTLTHRGLLINTGGRYRLGPTLAALLSGYDVPSLLKQLVPGALEQITRQTGESAVAVTFSGVRALRLGWSAARDELTTQIPDHVLDAPLGLATGQLLAAFQPEENWPTIIDHHLEATGRARNPRNRHELTRLFQAIRRQGDNPQPEHNYPKLAVPVRDASGQVVAALGTSCPPSRSTRKHFNEMLDTCRQVADELSARLGYTGADIEAASIP